MDDIQGIDMNVNVMLNAHATSSCILMQLYGLAKDWLAEQQGLDDLQGFLEFFVEHVSVHIQ